ncbi:hypothetical protein DTO282F9_1571 [Paecilomyces variotii]|nr:hypothetical protein DTO282F9_1571 [Paecilomyces variotii]
MSSRSWPANVVSPKDRLYGNEHPNNPNKAESTEELQPKPWHQELEVVRADAKFEIAGAMQPGADTLGKMQIPDTSALSYDNTIKGKASAGRIHLFPGTLCTTCPWSNHPTVPIKYHHIWEWRMLSGRPRVF